MKSLEQSGTRPWRTIWFNPLADLRRAAATWRRSSIPTRMSETSALGNSRQAPPGQPPINRGPRGGREVLGQIWVACISRIEPQTANSIFLESLSPKLLIIVSTILFILASFSVPLDREKDFYCPEKLFQRFDRGDKCLSSARCASSQRLLNYIFLLPSQGIAKFMKRFRKKPVTETGDLQEFLHLQRLHV